MERWVCLGWGEAIFQFHHVEFEDYIVEIYGRMLCVFEFRENSGVEI